MSCVCGGGGNKQATCKGASLKKTREVVPHAHNRHSTLFCHPQYGYTQYTPVHYSTYLFVVHLHPEAHSHDEEAPHALNCHHRTSYLTLQGLLCVI